MFELILENKAGDQLTFGMDSPFTITNIDGLNPPSSTINMSQVALIDGAKFNSSKMNVRLLNIAFAIEYDAAKNRIEVFKVLKSKQYVKVIYKGQYRNVYIEGYIESMPITYFDMKQIVTVSIICPSPYFMAAQEIVNNMRNIISTFHFPFASEATPELVFGYINNDVDIRIDNDGDVECGMIIELYARDSVSDPKVYDYVSQQYIGVVVDMQTADLITIDTRKGHLSATLLRNGVVTNLFNNVMQGSTWLQLPANGGSYVYEVSEGSTAELNVSFHHTNLYEGV